MNRKCRRDINEKAIVEALRKVGATVEFLDIAQGPDLLVGCNNINYLMEVKQPKKELRQEQLDWHIKWRGLASIVRSVDDALFLVKRGRIK
jgi:hypothetical protein